MTDFEDALGMILASCRPLPQVESSLDLALNRSLSSNIRSASALPRFDASAVDGYALRSSDTAQTGARASLRLSIQDSVAAGSEKHARLEPAHAIRIFTGAIMPSGADSVVMQEHVVCDGDEIVLEDPVKQGANVRYKSEEFAKGAVVLTKGTLLTPPAMGMLAALGIMSVPVHGLPRVEIIVTGNELVNVDETLTAGKIFDMNGVTLNAAVRSLGLAPVRTTRVDDNPSVIRRAIRTALRRCDILITAGGVSVGDYDFVAGASTDEGVRLRYNTLAIKPGKPNVFGTYGRTLFFGLPGNPVAALLTFHLLVRPAVERMMGLPVTKPIPITARLTAQCRKKPGRMEFVRAILESDEAGCALVSPVRAQDSHMLSGVAQANCIIRFPKDAAVMNAGENVSVTLLRWGL